MKCPNCQTENPDDSKFCKECATSLAYSGKTKGSFTKPLDSPSLMIKHEERPPRPIREIILIPYWIEELKQKISKSGEN